MSYSNSSSEQTENAPEMEQQLCFRESHIEWLKTFLLEHIHNGKPGVAYLEGPPGTGKTSTFNVVSLMPIVRENYKKIIIDCTQMVGNCIYKEICQVLKLYTPNGDYYKELKRYLSTKPKNLLLVLDHLDSLGVTTNEKLYRLLTFGSLVIVGIGKGPLLIPILKSWLPSLTITSMVFSPYEKKHILDILIKKLSYEPKVFFKKTALEVLAEMVSKSSGDMGEAVIIMRLVVKLRRQKDGYSVVHLSDVHDLLHQLRKPWILNLNEDMTLHEKVFLCAVLMILPRYRKETLAFGMVYNIYAEITRTHGIPSLDIPEAWKLCENLACRKILRAINLNNCSIVDWHIRLFGDREKIEGDLKKTPLFCKIIEQADSFFITLDFIT